MRAVAAVALLRRLRLLTAGDERRQPVDVAVIRLRHVLGMLLVLLRPRLKVLRLGLRLRMLLVALVILLRLARRERLAADDRLLVLAVVEGIVGEIAARVAGLLLLLLVIGLILPELLLRGGDQAEIMLGMLIVILGSDRIAGTLRVTRQLEVLLADVGCGSPDFYVRPIGLVHAR